MTLAYLVAIVAENRHTRPVLLGHRMKTLLLAMGCAIAMTASVSAQSHDDLVANQRPATKAEIAGVLQAMRDYLNDPYSVRDVTISTVMTKARRDGSVFHMICVDGNAKNAYGAYIGKQTTMVLLNTEGQHFNSSRAWSDINLCKRLTWRAFTEVKVLQGL